MFGIPRAPLLLGLAGLLPFVAGAFISTIADIPPPDGDYPLIVSSDGTKLLVLYGTIILSFMSGVLWGFATKATGPAATIGYILSVLPALWTLVMRGGTDTDTLLYLLIGFLGLLVLDLYFFRADLTPPWWMRLRGILTSVVVICLTLGITA